MIKKPFLNRTRKRYVIGMCFVAPCIIILALMMFNPVIQTFIYSFSEVKLPFLEVEFKGLDNYIKIFDDDDMGRILKNTLIWTVASVILRIGVGLWSAIIMKTNVKGIGALRLIALLPWTIPSIVASNTWRWIMQTDYGVLNTTLRSIGLADLAQNWLGSSQYAMGAVLVAFTWSGYPFVMMMILSGMQSIPKEHYEAARLDGANEFNLFRHITLPAIKPVLVIIIILQTINGINAFDMLYTMTGGGPAGSTEILGLYIQRLGFQNYNFGGSAAVSTMLIVVAMFIFVFKEEITKRVEKKKREG